MAEKYQVSIQSLQEDLKNGLDRKEIAKKYGTTQTQVHEWFKHEKLKGLRVIVKRESPFELVDTEVQEITNPFIPGVTVIEGQAEEAAAEEAATTTASPATAQTTVADTQATAPATTTQETKTEAEAAPAVTAQKGTW